MRINHNLSAMNTHRQMGITTTEQGKSTEKLSSGYRINRAADDAAGLSISEKMRGQIRGLTMASKNSQDAISMIQTAEGALNETHDIIQRMRELAVQAASDTNTTTDRGSIQDEITQLTSEIDRIANTTEFNTKKLLNGDLEGPITEKFGKGKVEGNFANGAVTVSNSANVSLALVTDVIRVRFVKDNTDAANISAGSYSLSSVLGNIAVASVLVSGGTSVQVSTAVAAQSFGATSFDGATILTYNLTNLDKIKAGDVITITLGKYTANAAATTDSARMQIGANSAQEMEVKVGKMTSKNLDIRQTNGQALDVTTQLNASGSVELFNLALEKVSTERSKLGALQNRLEHTIKNLDTSAENLQASESRIRDVDMAKEMMNYSKNNILLQASQAMLAQANQAPQGVLQLLR